MLDSGALAGVVYADFLLTFSGAAAVQVDVNVQKQVPAKEYISALAEGFINAAKTQVLLDNSSGQADGPGNAPPVPCQIPGAASAVPVFLAASGWAGPQSAGFAAVAIEKMLTRFAQQTLVMMNPNAAVGTGVGSVNPGINSGLGQAFGGALQGTLQAAFLARPMFCRNFNPSNGVNPEVLKVLPAYAQAYGVGLQTLTATVSYTGTGLVPAGASTVNTGRFQ